MIQPEIEKGWKSTCKILFGEELGSILDYRDYLKRYINLDMTRLKSALSDQQVSISHGDMLRGARIISNGETSGYLKQIGNLPLDINQIKDIDSLLEAVYEKAYYAGNVVLGNSKIVQDSDRCINSSIIYDVQSIHEGCKQIAFARYIRDSEYCYGLTLSGENKFVIHGYEVWKLTRGFEAFRTYVSSDCYYTGNLEGCQNCMFSFNQRNKSYLIGNIQLTKERYEQLRGKLLEDISGKLKLNKELPSIIDLISTRGQASEEADRKSSEADVSDVDLAFSRTTEVIFGKKLENVRDYESWLTDRVGRLKEVKSALSKNPVYLPPLECIDKIKNNVATMEEALNFGKKTLKTEDLENLTIGNAKELVSSINTVSPEIIIGDNINVQECAAYAFAVDVYRCAFAYWLQHSAYSFYPKETEYAFGVSSCFFSKFVIKCTDSDNLTRCFELDGCSNCSDSYFCHNCEGLSNCMFCFNVKSMSYAIANVEVGKEEYMRIKNLLLARLQKELEETKSVSLNIYNIGCKGK